MGSGWGSGRRVRTPISNWRTCSNPPVINTCHSVRLGVFGSSVLRETDCFLSFHIILYHYFSVLVEPCLELFTHDSRGAFFFSDSLSCIVTTATPAVSAAGIFLH